jgi:hypothetical protein
VAASARPTVIFAIDDAAANDVMVFRMVRRSGLLYRIVSSLAAVCFDCLIEVVWLATNTARLGFGTMARNHDSLAATMPNGPAWRRGAEEVGVFPFRILPLILLPMCSLGQFLNSSAWQDIEIEQEKLALGKLPLPLWERGRKRI